MTILLRQLEQNVPEDALVLGEELIERNAVQPPQLVDKNLWTAQVLTYEVELKATQQKLLAATCECERFQQDSMCEHIVASALVLRLHLSEKQVKRQADQPTAPTLKKLTTKSILQQLSQEKLRAFAQEYAARDRNFALALKARFIGQIELSDDKDKYLQLLDDAIRNARKKDRNISQRGKQKLLKVANELSDQLASAFAQQHYRSVLYIAQSFIEKLTPILRKLDEPKEIRALISMSFQWLHQLGASAIPPALLDELWDYATTEFSKITYRINEVVPAFFQLQYQLATQLHRKPELLEQLNTFAAQDTSNTDSQTQLLIQRMTLMDELGETEQANILLRDHADHPELLVFVVQQAFDRQAYAQAKQLAQQALALTLPRDLHRQLIRILLSIASLEKDTKAVARYAEQRLFQSHSTEDYDLLKAHYEGDWNEKWRDLVTRIQRTSFSIERRNLVAHIYASEQEFKALIEYISRLQSLDILQYVTSNLLNNYAEEVEQLYQQLTHHYLQHHVGRQASLRIREKLTYLDTIGARALARRLSRYLLATFPERHTLVEELATFS